MLAKDSEKTATRPSDWLTELGGLISAISAVAAGLATIFALFFPDLGVVSQRIAFIVAGVLAIGSFSASFYRKRREASLKYADSLEPMATSAALRGLLPFEDGDDLPARSRDIQDIKTLVTSSDFRFGVLLGESGCGKTSLLRAGLIPKLLNERFIPIYIPRPTHDPIEAIWFTLLKEYPQLDKRSEKGLDQLMSLTASSGKRIIVIIDQFEEYFLINRTHHSRTSFPKWLKEIIERLSIPICFLISIRTDFFAQLHSFAPYLADPTSTRTTYQLQNFDTEQAKQFFSVAARADAILFEPELVQAVVHELETDELIRPAELQVVGTRLKRKNITKLYQYESLGGARGILSSYISDEIKRSANEQATRVILRLMCADLVDVRSPNDLSLEEIRKEIGNSQELSSNIRTGTVQSILNQLVAARILIYTDEGKFNLVHDYLTTYVRAATEGTETRTERADRLLRRYLAE